VTARARQRINVHNLTGELVDAQDRLEDYTNDYAEAADHAAIAEAGYKSAYARAMLATVPNDGSRVPVADREAQAMVVSADELATWLICKARQDACRQGLLTARARQDSIRTLIASERALIR